MGSSSSKFKKYLQHGDEYAAMQVYQNSGELRRWVILFDIILMCDNSGTLTRVVTQIPGHIAAGYPKVWNVPYYLWLC